MMQRSGGKIRPPKGMLKADGAEGLWAVLKQALIDIHLQNASKHSYEHLYRAAYNMVRTKHGERLFKNVQEFEKDWFITRVIPKVQSLLSPNLVDMALGEGTQGISDHEKREMGDTLLRGIRDAWAVHTMCMNMVADVLMYLDNCYLKENHCTAIFTVTIGLFRDHLLMQPIPCLGRETDQSVLDIVSFVILGQINMERDGDVVDRNLIRRCVKMMDSLYHTDQELDSERLYLLQFEKRYLDHAHTYYKAEAAKLLSAGDASAWLNQTYRRLLEEEDRCRTTIMETTAGKIAKVVEKELIEKHLKDFMDLEHNGLQSMIDNDRTPDLAILFKLISRVDPQKEALKDGLTNRIEALGAEIEMSVRNTDFSVPPAAAAQAGQGPAQPLSQLAQLTAAAIKWVDDVMELKEKFDKQCTECFDGDLAIQSTITKAFSDFIHKFQRSSEYMSLFIDDNLKRGIRGKSDVEVTAILEKAIILVQYLKDKDLFERYYQKHLARRLLHGKSGSEEVEKQMISLMQLNLGKNFTAKFEGMFKDITISEELSGAYQEHVRNLGDDGDRKPIALAINVLTTINWPHDVLGRSVAEGDGPGHECIYPPEIQRVQDSFFKFYLKDKTGRKLTWVGAAGSADVKCVFPRIPGKQGSLGKERRYELHVSTYGMVVLMLFNDVDSPPLTLSEIQARTKIPERVLKGVLASLSLSPKSRVLLKEPSGKLVKPDDKFSFNANFMSKTIRIKAPMMNAMSKVEGDEERKETESKNDKTRHLLVDAAVVRIMKSRREMGHNELLTEVIDQLTTKFKPEVPMIKARIESLINREYLERKEDPQGLSSSSTTGAGYKYLA